MQSSVSSSDDRSQAQAAFEAGLGLHRAGQIDEAITAYRRALELWPGHPQALINLGTALRTRGALEESIATLQRVIALEPHRPMAYVQLGQTLYRAGRRAEAARAFESAGYHFRERNLFDPASTSYRRALALDPTHAPAYLAWALTLQQQGRTEEAVAALERGLEWEPEDPAMAFYLAAWSGRDVPARAPDAHVVTLYDQLAPRFDDAARDRLRYGVPELLVGLVGRVLGPDSPPAGAGPTPAAAGQGLDVLDGGCGTGLYGPLLRPLARRLVGVDLSPGMLERAADRGVYDELRQAELTAALAAEHATFDLVVLADVLISFGALEPVFGAAAGALRPGGLLAVSIELSDDDGYALEASLRYVHGAEYVARAAAAAGLRPIAAEDCTLRGELDEPLDEPVEGMLVVFRKESTAT